MHGAFVKESWETRGVWLQGLGFHGPGAVKLDASSRLTLCKMLSTWWKMLKVGLHVHPVLVESVDIHRKVY